jgi:hypothetical protein
VRHLRPSFLPVHFISDLYIAWARSVDPLVFANPTWIAVLSALVLWILSPAAAFFALGFWHGSGWVRTPASVLAGCGAYSTALFFGCYA